MRAGVVIATTAINSGIATEAEPPVPWQYSCPAVHVATSGSPRTAALTIGAAGAQPWASNIAIASVWSRMPADRFKRHAVARSRRP